MGHAEGDCGARTPEVDHGDGALQLVMSGLVEEEAESGDAHIFTDKIQGETRGAAAESARDWIQFLTTAAKIVFGDDEVGGAEGGVGGEQGGVLAVPKSMSIGGSGRRSYGSRRNYRSG